jgi:AcrR family transcriptional regulator
MPVIARSGDLVPCSETFSCFTDIYRISDIATQEARKAETRQRLIDAAADLFATRGVHAVSLEAIADAADRTTGAIYSHFGGKVGLLVAVLDQTSRQVGRDTRAALDRLGDTDARLEALWATFVERTDGPDDAWMLLEHELWLYAARNPEAREHLADRFRHTRHVMGASFDQWVSESDRPPQSSSNADHHLGETSTLVLALLYGLEMQRRIDPGAVPNELAVRGLLALFGLASSSEDDPLINNQAAPTQPAERQERERTHAN